LSFGLTSLAGVIVGIIAVYEIHRSQGRLGGHGLATAGLTVSVVVTLMVAAVVGPGFCDASPESEEMSALSRAKTVGSVMRSYARGHDGTLPAANGWTDALQARCEIDALVASRYPQEGHRALAMNTHLDGVSLSQVKKPTRTVLLFEVDRGAPLAGGRELLPTAPRYKDGYLILFVNGSAEFVPRKKIETLLWKP
jgi:hypothetical protein